MDTSPEYVEMCKKAQKYWENVAQYKMGDWFKDKYSVYVLQDDLNSDYIGDRWTTRESLIEDMKKDEAVFLPRQDQLQEIVLPHIEQRVEKSCAGWRLAKEFVETMGNLVWGREWMNIKIDPGSMEQLWLAFVMKEKYGKTWNGEEWVP